jgi:hypothetical protein
LGAAFGLLPPDWQYFIRNSAGYLEAAMDGPFYPGIQQ